MHEQGAGPAAVLRDGEQMTEGRSIESELAKRRAQSDSVRGKDTPFRVEFRYGGGTKHWQYFVSEQDAVLADDSMCLYGRQAIRLSESHYPVLFRCAGHAADGIGLQFLKACAADA